MSEHSEDMTLKNNPYEPDTRDWLDWEEGMSGKPLQSDAWCKGKYHRYKNSGNPYQETSAMSAYWMTGFESHRIKLSPFSKSDPRTKIWNEGRMSVLIEELKTLKSKTI